MKEINFNNIKILITDLDGTLLNDEGKISGKDYKTLELLSENNVYVVAATGRSLYSVNKVVDKKSPFDFIIFGNGSGIVNFSTKDIFENNFIPANEVNEIVSILDELKLDFQIRKKVPNGHKYSFKLYSKNNPDFERLNQLYSEHIEPLNNIKELFDASRIITISGNIEHNKIIKEKFKNYTIIRATSPIDNVSIWTEIYPKGINKGTAVQKLCKKLDTDLKYAVGIGNDYNDIDFLNIVGNSFITANAAQELKAKYKTITNNNNNPITDVFIK